MPGQWQLGTVDPAEIDAVDATLKRWEGVFGTATGFASGDLGWALRNGYEQVAQELRVFRDSSGVTGAVAMVESPTALWLTISPAHLMDWDLAEAIASAAVDHGFLEVATVSPPAPIRRALASRSYAIDPSPWVHLWKSLTDHDVRDQPNVFATSTDALIDQRIAVQFSAFENSTFNRSKWETMVKGPSFVPDLDLIALNDGGEGVSALTGWLPGRGACGVVEPMGTHSDHRRQGHGLRVLHACFSEMRKLGGSGIRVLRRALTIQRLLPIWRRGFG